MKRCPQCEFIYEDDQSLCDMDGALLVFDARTLPSLHALAPIEVPVAARSPWRHRTFPMMAALILATVLSLVYFVSTQRTTHAPARINSASIPAPVLNPVQSVEVTPAPPAPEVNSATAAPVKEETKPEANKAAATSKAAAAPAAAAAKKPAVKTPTTERQPPAEPKKEESKVGSILKKTGRLLKKPFKF